MAHTILLIQPTGDLKSRTYSDYESVNEAMEGVLHLYEAHLQEAYPTRSRITYDLADLYTHIDALHDLSALVYSQESAAYMPKDKKWIKERVHRMLKQQQRH